MKISPALSSKSAVEAHEGAVPVVDENSAIPAIPLALDYLTDLKPMNEFDVCTVVERHFTTEVLIASSGSIFDCTVASILRRTYESEFAVLIGFIDAVEHHPSPMSVQELQPLPVAA